MTVRILVADDHPVVRHGLRALIGSHFFAQVKRSVFSVSHGGEQ